MSIQENSKSNPDQVLKALWRNWAVAFGAITLPVLIGSFVPKIWLPFIAFAEVWALVATMKSNLTKAVSSCSLIVMLASRALICVAIGMLAVVILCTDWLVPTVIHLELYNSEIPFITCLITFPVVAVLCAMSSFLGFGTRYCRDCQRRNGYYAGDSIIATLYFRESRYQVTMLLIVALVLGGVEYWYYFARYINANLNAPDRFFFNYMPVAIYLLSLLFMGGRYTSMRALYTALEDAAPAKRNSTSVRFLVFCGDELLLKENKDGQWDTPFDIVIGRTTSVGDHRARILLEEAAGLKDFQLRYCFTNEGYVSGANIIHYAAFVSEDNKALFGTDMMWFNPYMLDRGLAENMLGTLLANELFRIHTITMAWKTYDRNGRRLYPIRNYRPTFRLRDLRDWSVDYDDETWFDVANNNEDRNFYRLRGLWERLTNVFVKKERRNEA